MSTNKDYIFDILKEEYNKRVNHFLELQEITIKDKDDNDLIEFAKGLKVKDRAGFSYTILDIIEKDSEIFIRLLAPGEGLDNLEINKSYLQINEDDKEKSDIKNKKVNSDIIPRKNSSDFKRSFKVNIDSKSYNEEFTGEYLDVPIKEFEDNFSL